jgi:hypothetical protein
MFPQTLYKYRSFENWRLLVDILVNHRLYAAPFKDLNDPMEGRYYFFSDELSKAFRRLVPARKDEWRICSLTSNPSSTLMWSYYSGGHTGVVLGLTVLLPPSRAFRIEQVRDDTTRTSGASSQRVHLFRSSWSRSKSAFERRNTISS